MHDMPEDLARAMDRDSYEATTGARPQDLVPEIPGDEGVEATVEGNQNLPASRARSAEETERIGRARVESDTIGGQG